MKTYKTKAKSLSLIAVKESESPFNAINISVSNDAYQFARQFYHDDINLYESFFLIMLNRANNTKAFVKISQGGTFSTVVDPMIVAKYAIDSLASAVILVHNHPSGNLAPSKTDKDITQKIKNGLKLFDIKVLDHLIITEDNYYSFADYAEI